MNKLTRRDFVTKLLSVPVAAVAGVAAIGVVADKEELSVDWSGDNEPGFQGRKTEYIIVDDPQHYDDHQWSRDEQTEILAKWYNSKIDQEIHRRMTHGLS